MNLHIAQTRFMHLYANLLRDSIRRDERETASRETVAGVLDLIVGLTSAERRRRQSFIILSVDKFLSNVTTNDPSEYHYAKGWGPEMHTPPSMPGTKHHGTMCGSYEAENDSMD